MKILKTKSITPKDALSGIRKAIRKAEKVGRVGSNAGRLEGDIKFKLQLVANELENLTAFQEVMVQHYEKVKSKKNE